MCRLFIVLFFDSKNIHSMNSSSAIYFLSCVLSQFIYKQIVANFMRFSCSIHFSAGQEKFRAMTPMYYRNANAALLCFDLTNYKSFLDVKDWVQELHKCVSLFLFMHTKNESPNLICVFFYKFPLYFVYRIEM